MPENISARLAFTDWVAKESNSHKVQHIITATAPEALIKAITTKLAVMSYAGNVSVCNRCNGSGEYRGLDASGSADWLHCRFCDGWGVAFSLEK